MHPQRGDAQKSDRKGSHAPGPSLPVHVQPRVVPRQASYALWSERVHHYRQGNILERPFATIIERIRKLRMHVLVHRCGDADAARLRQRLEATGYVDAVPMDIVAAGYDVAEVDANAQLDTLCVCKNGVSLGHRLLQRDGTNHCLDRTRELHQNAVAFDPDDPPSVGLEIWPDDVPQHILQTPPGSDLVPTGESAIANDIGKQDRFESAFHARLRHQVPFR